MAVTKDDFKRLLQGKLGSFYQRAEKVFDDFGPNLTYDVTNVFLHAVDQGEEKIKEVLGLLEKHLEEHLQYQHPDIRGTVHNSLGVNETQVMFVNLCEKNLGLQPTQ